MKRYNIKNVIRFLRELLNCYRLQGNLLTAYGFLRSGHRPLTVKLSYHSMPFFARKEDWVAVKEVLVNDEYKCIEYLVFETQQPKILDLGANIGTFALRVFKRFKNASVVSVEAAEDTYHVLKKNRDLNDKLDWTVFNFAVWGHDGPLRLSRKGSPVSHRVTSSTGDELVNGISLNTLLSKIHWDQVDLIKMDIEGSEESVVPISVDILNNTNYFLIEIHNDRIDGELIFDILKDIYPYIQKIDRMHSNKPLYLMSKKSI